MCVCTCYKKHKWFLCYISIDSWMGLFSVPQCECYSPLYIECKQDSWGESTPLHVLEGWRPSYSWLHAENDGRDKEAAGGEDTHNGHVRVSFFCVSLSWFVRVCALYRVFEGTCSHSNIRAFKQMFECFHIHWSPSVLFVHVRICLCVSLCAPEP